MQCIAGKHAPPEADRNTSTLVRGRAGVRHLRAGELAAVRRAAGAAAAFALNHTATGGGDLLSPEFSPRPVPTRPAKATGLGSGRVVPLRPDLVGWTRPLTGGEPLHLLPGRGRHHRPTAPVRLSLDGYAHPAPAGVASTGTAGSGVAPATPARAPVARRRPRVRRCASRVRAYVSHPGGDLAPLALAVRAYLGRGVR